MIKLSQPKKIVDHKNQTKKTANHPSFLGSSVLLRNLIQKMYLIIMKASRKA